MEKLHPKGVFSWEKRQVARWGGREERGGRATMNLSYHPERCQGNISCDSHNSKMGKTQTTCQSGLKQRDKGSTSLCHAYLSCRLRCCRQMQGPQIHPSSTGIRQVDENGCRCEQQSSCVTKIDPKLVQKLWGVEKPNQLGSFHAGIICRARNLGWALLSSPVSGRRLREA